MFFGLIIVTHKWSQKYAFHLRYNNLLYTTLGAYLCADSFKNKYYSYTQTHNIMHVYLQIHR